MRIRNPGFWIRNPGYPGSASLPLLVSFSIMCSLFKVELEALLGLIYMRGLLGANLIDVSQLWSIHFSPVFAATMSQNRFSFLMSHLRLDHKPTRDITRDKFAAARQILTLFNINCARAMQCGAWLAFDETLYPNRGNGYGFRMYIGSKPWKYGILYRSLNDAEVAYTYQVHACAGKPAGEPTEHYVQGAAMTIITCLDAYVAEGNSVKGCNVTIDRAYSNIHVVQRLGEKYQMTAVGTICSNRKGLPPHFKNPVGRKVGDYQVLWDVDSNINIHSEIVKKKSGQAHNVLVISTMYPILGLTKDNKKPAIVNLYNVTMGGTDIVDLLMTHKTVRWKSNRWNMSAFAFMLDTAVVNANTIAGLHDGMTKPDTRDFRYELVAQLVLPHIRRWLVSRGIQTHIRTKAQLYMGKYFTK